MSNNNKLISLSVDLMKIPKDRIIEGKNGAKYINLDVTIKDEKDQYDNDCSVTIRQSKEERAAKAGRVFVGNGKKLFGWDDNAHRQQQSKPSDNGWDNTDSSLPF